MIDQHIVQQWLQSDIIERTIGCSLAPWLLSPAMTMLTGGDGSQKAERYLSAEHIALVVVEALHQAGVVPALNGVVGTIMDLHLYGVASIVDQEDDRIQPVPDHSGHILRWHDTHGVRVPVLASGRVLLPLGQKSRA